MDSTKYVVRPYSFDFHEDPIPFIKIKRDEFERASAAVGVNLAGQAS